MEYANANVSNEEWIVLSNIRPLSKLHSQRCFPKHQCEQERTGTAMFYGLHNLGT